MSSQVELNKFKILYCEDEKGTRESLVGTLSRLTDNIIVAVDGEDGFKKFKETSPDIIITDIRMPGMDGIEMVKAIRELDSDIPIIVTSAFDEQEYLLQAIELSVDKYLIKPLERKSLLDAIDKIAISLENKKIAYEFILEKEREKVNNNTVEVMTKFADTFPTPVLIIENKKISYINNKFKDMIGVESSDNLLVGKNNLDNLLERKDGFCHTLSNLRPEDSLKNKISIHTKKGRRIFLVAVEYLDISSHDSEKILYIFNDITALEYQKLKVKHYNLRLEDFSIKAKYRRHTSRKEDRAEEGEKEALQVRAMRQDEAEMLRRSHQDKITAVDFVETIDESLFDDIDELGEIEDEFDAMIVNFLKSPSKEALFGLVGKLDRYAFTVRSLSEFGELSQALFSTRDVLSNISELDEKKSKVIAMFLENILHDLSSWRKKIFVEKSTIDIHYLDSSLFSSCLQLELSITGVKATNEDDNDDLELF